jgi:hypothetical protein
LRLAGIVGLAEVTLGNLFLGQIEVFPVLSGFRYSQRARLRRSGLLDLFVGIGGCFVVIRGRFRIRGLVRLGGIDRVGLVYLSRGAFAVDELVVAEEPRDAGLRGLGGRVARVERCHGRVG